jgi:predicted O-methyltransferase YrrM
MTVAETRDRAGQKPVPQRSIRNIFACLVHENPECVIDLVRNLRALDPSSVILLYNGGRCPDLLDRHFPFERYGAVIHPSPRPVTWGTLHQFALDSMQYALETFEFDTLTIVDSDQLATRAGYSEYLGRYLGQFRTRPGMLGNAPAVMPSYTRAGPAATAFQEIDLWRPFLRRFPSGEQKFVHWSFWPSTVFTAEAARDLTELFKTSDELQAIMWRTRIWASEEVILPTLVALLGYDIAANPCSYDFVKYRTPYSLAELEAALAREDVFWLHPVPRHYNDRLRQHVREKLNHYEERANMKPAQERPASNGLLLTMPILATMRTIEGWLDDAEADLLIATSAKALAEVPDARTIVEIGSYCGRSTVVLGSVIRALRGTPGPRLYAIDPHDGRVGALDRGIHATAPTFEKFRRNIAAAGLAEIVQPVQQCSFQVPWTEPICYLFIDGLHDYANVARDFYHFEKWLAPGAYVAFHDYADYWPGVKTFVNELLEREEYERVHCALSMMVLRKRLDEERPVRIAPAADSAQTADGAGEAPPAVLTQAPLVSCLMPTADRRAFVPQAIEYFLRQDYPHRELIVLDDGSDPVADLIPLDSRIRYIRTEGRRTLGAKHNAGCELAAGDLIAHWDDDDWMADWRLSYQVQEVMARPAPALTGLSHIYFYDPYSERAWQYIYPPEHRPWVYGASLCYRKEFWQSHRFPDMNEGVDTVFVWGLERDLVRPLHDHRFVIAIIHPHNTSRKRTEGFGWHTCLVEDVHALIDRDRPFYQMLATGRLIRSDLSTTLESARR